VSHDYFDFHERFNQWVDEDDPPDDFKFWVMAWLTLPEGHVTDPVMWAGLTKTAARNAQLKALGNGVVPAQAAAAIRHLLDRAAQRLAL
jgi:hypothetical protein